MATGLGPGHSRSLAEDMLESIVMPVESCPLGQHQVVMMNCPSQKGTPMRRSAITSVHAKKLAGWSQYSAE